MHLNENGNEFSNKIKISFWTDSWTALPIKAEELATFKFGIRSFSA